MYLKTRNMFGKVPISYIRDSSFLGVGLDDPVSEIGQEQMTKATAVKQARHRTPRDVLDWNELIRFKVPADIVKSIRDPSIRRDRFSLGMRYFTVQTIESARSDDVNLDYYPVYVSKMPTIDGTQLTANHLLYRFRTNINSFLDTDLAKFSPASTLDSWLWSLPIPRGAVLFIDIPYDAGYVVCSDFAPKYWRFSTVTEHRIPGGRNEHPVSGTREFGYVGTDQRAVFYTKGADRGSYRIELANRKAFEGGHKLWSSFQRKFVKFVNDHKGKAEMFWVGERGEPFISGRHNWRNVDRRIRGAK
jgi:hypothetical protein